MADSFGILIEIYSRWSIVNSWEHDFAHDRKDVAAGVGVGVPILAVIRHCFAHVSLSLSQAAQVR